VVRLLRFLPWLISVSSAVAGGQLFLMQGPLLRSVACAVVFGWSGSAGGWRRKEEHRMYVTTFLLTHVFIRL